MERIVYIRGKFRGTNKEMKEAYFYAKEMMRKYDLEPQYIGVTADEGWKGDKILTIKRKEKQLLKDLEKNILIRDASNFKFLDYHFVRLAIKDRKSNLKMMETLAEFVEYRG